MPWREDTSPYSIFISEVMLQQTQVSRVFRKYPEFLESFPSFSSLAEADLTDVLRAWQGMGYNRRGKYLRDGAKIIVEEHGGILPDNPVILDTLPGIGLATAGSISCFAYNKPTVFIETNIRRSVIFHFFKDQEAVHDSDILPIVQKCLQKIEKTKSISYREWYWALMDYGTYLATYISNPNRQSRHYAIQSKFEGSDRQVRGRLLRGYLSGKMDVELSKREKEIWKKMKVEGLVS